MLAKSCGREFKLHVHDLKIACNSLGILVANQCKLMDLGF
jgi:hypothetical protein